MKKLVCLLFTVFFVFAMQTTIFAFSIKVDDVQAESKTTFSDAANVPYSTDTTVYLIAAKGKGENKSNAKYYLYILLVPNNDKKVDKVYSFKKNPVKLSFAKNGANKILEFKIHKDNVHIIPDWNYLSVSKLLIEEIRDELTSISDLKIMIPLTDGNYKTLDCPKELADSWNYVLTVDLEEVERNAK